MIGNNHKWDIESEPFWTSECGKYTCSTLGNIANGNGFGLSAKHLGHDWQELYDAVSEQYGDDLHRFHGRAEAEQAFSILSEGLI
jgi:hypothetical protein